MDYIHSGIKKYIPVIAYQQMLKRGLQVYLLDNYLELDIGYVTIDMVVARRGRWKVMFDKAGTVDEDMIKSWEQSSKDNRGKTSSVNMDEKLSNYVSEIWHYLFQAAIAIKRGEYWRATREMYIVGNMIIELKGLRHSLETKRCRDVDKFP